MEGDSNSHLWSGLLVSLLASSSVFSLRLLSEFTSGDHPLLNWFGNLLCNTSSGLNLGSFTLTIRKEQEPQGYRHLPQGESVLLLFSGPMFQSSPLPEATVSTVSASLWHLLCLVLKNSDPQPMRNCFSPLRCSQRHKFISPFLT